MKFCPECGDKIADNFTFCPSCGADLNQLKEDIDETHVIDKDAVEEPGQEIPSEESISEVEGETIEDENGDIWGTLSKIFIIGFVVLCIILGLFFIFPFQSGSILSNIQIPTSTSPTTVPTTQAAHTTVPTTQAMDKISILTKIVEGYHETHTYSKYDLFVCADMAIDVWDMVETQGINAKIEVGNVDDPNAKPENYNHAWVLAEVEPLKYVALETTGGYLVWESENANYYRGHTFDNPKEFKDYLDKLQHPCPDGYVLGSDNSCHQACGGSSYCTGNSVCVNGQCRGCNPGYIFGTDLQCHPECGSGYCTGESVCINGQCRGCDPGYVLGNDYRCHPACGSGYCTGESVCINGQCRGCDPGYVLGSDYQCHAECGASGRYCVTGTCYNGQCVTCPAGRYLATDGRCYSY